MLSTFPGPVSRWHFSLVFRRPPRLPVHHGSMLRGALGHQLKALHCQCPGADNKSHLAGCLYAEIFEQTGVTGLAGITEAPPAFVFSPLESLPSPETKALKPGSEALHRQVATANAFHPADIGKALVFRGAVTLLGQAHKQPDVFFLALRMAAAGGLGTPPAMAQLDQVHALDWQPPGETSGPMQLTFLSPLYLKQREKGQRNSRRVQADQITLRDIVVALHRRLCLLEQVYGVPGPNEQALETWLDWVEVANWHSTLHDEHFARRSNRQQQKMPLTGLMGSVVINTAPPPDLLQALHLGQWLHIGGKTGLGLGCYCLHPHPVNR